MAYGPILSVKLHVSTTGLQTMIPAAATGEVAEALFALDYAYNIMAVPALHNQGYAPDMSHFLSLMRKATISGVYITNSALRAMIQPDAQLQVHSLRLTSSFVIQIAGMDRLIEAIAYIFDPAVRAKRREGNRHEAVMNRLEEEKLILELARDRFKTMRLIANDMGNFNQRIKDELGDDQATELTELMTDAFAQAIYALRQNDIITLEAPGPTG